MCEQENEDKREDTRFHFIVGVIGRTDYVKTTLKHAINMLLEHDQEEKAEKESR